MPKEVTQAWLKYLRQELPTVAFKAATKKSGGIGHAQMPSGLSGSGQGKLSGGAQELLNSQECLGADTLLQLLKNYTRNLGVKTAITVGVIGMPNVGKSSLINSLKRSKVAQVRPPATLSPCLCVGSSTAYSPPAGLSVCWIGDRI